MCSRSYWLHLLKLPRPVWTEETYFYLFKCPADSWLFCRSRPCCTSGCFPCYLSMGAIVDCVTTAAAVVTQRFQRKQHQWFQSFHNCWACLLAVSFFKANLEFDNQTYSSVKWTKWMTFFLPAIVNACVEVAFFLFYLKFVVKNVESSDAAAETVWVTTDVCNKFSDLIL